MIMIAKNNKKNDIIFILSLLSFLLLIGLLMLSFSKNGDTVTVKIDKQIFGIYPLDKDRTVEIRTEHSFNLLIINDGRAYIKKADCPDGICVAHRPISKSGESIICLPNKVVVTITAEHENHPDIVISR